MVGAEAAVRSRRAMVRCARGAGFVGQAAMGKVAALPSSLKREKSQLSTFLLDVWPKEHATGGQLILECAVRASPATPGKT